MQQNNSRSILKLVLKKDFSSIQAQGPHVNKVIENVSAAIQKIERKLCRLCAKLKPVESLFPFFGTEYEQVINKLLSFGSVKVSGATNISSLSKDTKSDEVQNNKIVLVKIKQETSEMLCEEVAVENQVQLVSERFIHSEIEIKDEMAEMYSTDTDSLNDIINNDYDEVVVKDEYNEIEMIENEEISNGDALLDELDVKEETNESDDLKVQDKVEIETSDTFIANLPALEIRDKTNQVPSLNRNQKVKEAQPDILPEKSKDRYELAFAKFDNWRKLNKTEECSDNDIILAYFNQLGKNRAPSSLWTYYSMLKSTLYAKEGMRLEQHYQLQKFLKNKSRGYEPKKAKCFSPTEILKFIREAPDDVYLLKKVTAIFGLYGATRGCELKSMKIQHVKQQGDLLVVDIPKTETDKSRRFTVNETHAPLVKKYIALRPRGTTSDRFFLNYQHGKCTIQPLGVHKISACPSVIAEYLQLDEPKKYTGHAYRRTSATFLADPEGVEISE
ncbi:uncharacterized protein LOC117173304 isoform X3 [Belonocnema kinseyi]|uniref:uncharacterized protein LOC117173304 isoform X3 n=1 Tax=Belonocnema kinseyi TaxID=2817044 RepID=UPI00143DF745|nr:uncharacterized protein LOC117173304 isoform X3 [Belonocnema kinseyi]